MLANKNLISLLFGCSVVSWHYTTPWTAACQASIFHYLPEFFETHVQWVSDDIQPSHPPSPPSPLALNFFQHQGFFLWINSSYQVAKVLELQLQRQSFLWIFRVDSFRTDWLDLLAVQGTLKSLIQNSNFTIQKHQLFGAQISLWPNSHIHAWLLEKP